MRSREALAVDPSTKRSLSSFFNKGTGKQALAKGSKVAGVNYWGVFSDELDLLTKLGITRYRFRPHGVQW